MLSLFPFGQTGGGSPAPTPAPAPSFVDSVQGNGGSGSASATGLNATGSNRQVFAMVGAGTSDAVNDISCSITGSGGTTSMTRVFFRGTQNDGDPSTSLEAFAGFVIVEADLRGDGPYSIDATATGANVPDKVGIVAGSVQDAPVAATIVSARTNDVSTNVASADTLALAGLGDSTGSGSSAMTGATRVEQNNYSADGLQLGHVLASSGPLTVTNSVDTRNVSALALFPKG